jgi:cation:H+ antiporter
MPDVALAGGFVAATVVSLAASWLLVTALERVGARLGLSEALLGMVAALAADAPEITAAVTALTGHQGRIGAGVVIGSNVFNLAALLGLAAALARRIALHRRVIAMEGAVAVWIAATCLVVVSGLVAPAIGLAAVLGMVAPYLVALGVDHGRLRQWGLPDAWAAWLTSAIIEEEAELEVALHPRAGGRRDALLAALAVAVVVGASVAMEQAGSRLGSRHGVPQIVVGALVLAGVTSVPNAVAAVYLARRGRGSATLSTAMNSNALNVLAGLLIPATAVGLPATSGPATLVAGWYLGLTIVALAFAYAARGLHRRHGVLIICAYVAFAALVVSDAYA